MRLLITGGAGYLGSHAVRGLLDAGHEVVVLDDLSSGHADAVDPRARLVRADLFDPEALDEALRDRDAVLHFAARSDVAESVRAPEAYHRANVVATEVLLEAMARRGVHRLLFASSAATYGAPLRVPIAEDTHQRPISPYGRTKLAAERLLAALPPAFGHASLRFFNVAGCAWGLGERHQPENHLIPVALEVALGRREAVRIHGDDHPTPDGTCVRDFVHVADLVEAHRRVLEALRPGDRRVYNVGSGRGWSVREVIAAAERVTGRPIRVEVGPRREGDPPVLVTDPGRITAALGWRADRSDLATMIASHWDWLRAR